MLAVKLLMQQGITVTALAFSSHFFDTEKAKQSASQLSIPLVEINFSDTHLQMVTAPQHGYGAALNPCIDCHALMIKHAMEVVISKGYDIFATGEVLGQRPMSQHKRAFQTIEHMTGLSGRILRPLSAKLLLPTVYETNGLVDRDQLAALQGRSRKPQMQLAKAYGIHAYPTPAGGCVLTEREYAQKLRPLLLIKENSRSVFQLLDLGRHLWLDVQGGIIPLAKYQESTIDQFAYHLVIGRNQAENSMLEQLKGTGDVLVWRADTLGPTVLVRSYRGAVPSLVLDIAKQHIFSFSKHKPEHWESLAYTTK